MSNSKNRKDILDLESLLFVYHFSVEPIQKNERGRWYNQYDTLDEKRRMRDEEWGTS